MASQEVVTSGIVVLEIYNFYYGYTYRGYTRYYSLEEMQKKIVTFLSQIILCFRYFEYWVVDGLQRFLATLISE